MLVKLLSFILIFLVTKVSAREYVVAFPIQKFYPQYEVTSKTKRGLLVEVIEKFSKDNQISVKLESYPVNRYVALLKNDIVDFVLPDNPNWSTNKSGFNLHFSNPIMESEVVFFSKKPPSQEKVKSIATINGYVVGHFQEQIKGKIIEVMPIHSTEALIQFVEKERADVGYHHKDIVLSFLKENPQMNITLREDLPKSQYTYHLSSKNHPKLIEKFNIWLKENQDWLEKKKVNILTSS